MNSIQAVKDFMAVMEKQGHTTPSVTKQTLVALEKAERVVAEDPKQPSPDDLCKTDYVKDVFTRFLTKFSGEIQPASAGVYVNRVIKAAENYCQYRANALDFKPSFAKAELNSKREKSTKAVNGNGKKSLKTSSEAAEYREPRILAVPPAEGGNFSTAFPLRKNLMVNLNLPRDLKTKEVQRMAYHLVTLCEDFRPGVTVWPQGSATDRESLPPET